MDELLEALDDKVRQAMLDGAAAGMATGVKRTVAAAKLLAPVDTGMLRASITSRVERTDDDVTGVVVANTTYAAYVEFGTGEAGESSAGDKAPGVATYTPGHKGVPAHPYMYPAALMTQDLAARDIDRAVAQRLAEVMG
jgi:HK97 gp10 family phage protein